MKKRKLSFALLLIILVFTSFTILLKDIIYDGQEGKVTNNGNQTDYPNLVRFTIKEKPDQVIREEFNNGEKILSIQYSYGMGSSNNIYKLIDNDGNDAELEVDEASSLLKLRVDADNLEYKKHIQWKIAN